MLAIWRQYFTFVFSAAGLAAGAVATLAGAPEVASWMWAGVTAVVLALLVVSLVVEARKGETGLDLIAVAAMAGALALGEYLAGAVIAVMLASGRGLEQYARSRAQRELSALVARAPRVAYRYQGTSLVEVAAEAVQPGDHLLVKPGDVVPVDGMVLGNPAVIDESALTGEAMPVERPAGSSVSSGCVNAGGPFELRALAAAASSTYAGVLRLVREAQASKAPFVRLASRYAMWFVPLTGAVAGIAWAASGDAVRALAVLVVATPCPLLLAAPVAIVSGISRAARRGILIKGGGALEVLARARVLLFDKTGTLTTGQARLLAIETCGSFSAGEVLALAASLEQVSLHVIAGAVVSAARARGVALAIPSGVEEIPGAGIRGEVNERMVALGNLRFASGEAVSSWARRMLRRARLEGASVTFVAVDGELAGALLLADEIRPETARALRGLRKQGIHRIVLVSGDRQDAADAIATALGVDAVLAERSPADKVEAVLAERAGGVTVMVGDGINDAPALAAADVGVAMGARGAGASSEAADVVLLVDRLDRLAEALAIARRSRSIALQSVLAGMGMSITAMVFAGAGWLAPVAGAVLQEAIDVTVILNALRALGWPWRRRPRVTLSAAQASELRAEHDRLSPMLDRIRKVADRLDALAPAEARSELRAVEALLREHVLPHERSDDTRLYPLLAEILGGEDPMGALSRTHREIHHLARLYTRLVEELPEEGPSQEDLRDLRRVLYGVAAILKLHNEQEEEIFAAVAEDAPRRSVSHEH